jgi:CRISPR/Cas system CSM-associated protein Csm5 (group 7 of RAMP superfamily)
MFEFFNHILKNTAIIKAIEVHTKGKNGDFIAVNHFTKEGDLFEFDSNDITENLIESRNELNLSYQKKLSFYQHFCQNHQQRTGDHFQK